MPRDREGNFADDNQRNVMTLLMVVTPGDWIQKSGFSPNTRSTDREKQEKAAECLKILINARPDEVLAANETSRNLPKRADSRCIGQWSIRDAGHPTIV